MVTRARGIRSSRFTARLAPLLGALVLIAGCGGSSNPLPTKTTTSTPTTPTTSTTKTGTKKPVPPASLTVTQGILTAGSTTPVTHAAVAPGSSLSFATRVPGGPKVTSKVTVALSLGPAKKLTVVASARGHSSTATVTSSNGKPLTLASIRYLCLFPPKPSACPLGKVAGSASRDSVQVRARGGSLLVFGATIGPVKGAHPIHPVSTSGPAVPAYKVVELVRSTPAKSGTRAPKPSAAGTTVSVNHGDTVSFFARAVGAPGAPQLLTIKAGDGPAKSILVTAAVPHGTSSQITIKSATGKPISLVTPRFICYLPPTPTFCPASQITAQASGYSAIFSVTPSTPPVFIIATVN